MSAVCAEIAFSFALHAAAHGQLDLASFGLEVI